MKLNISTHALTEGDFNSYGMRQSLNISTHALTEGDIESGYRWDASCISTHALTEGDAFATEVLMASLYFNSRPHGGRRQI